MYTKEPSSARCSLTNPDSSGADLVAVFANGESAGAGVSVLRTNPGSRNGVPVVPSAGDPAELLHLGGAKGRQRGHKLAIEDSDLACGIDTRWPHGHDAPERVPPSALVAFL